MVEKNDDKSKKTENDSQDNFSDHESKDFDDDLFGGDSSNTDSNDDDLFGDEPLQNTKESSSLNEHTINHQTEPTISPDDESMQFNTKESSNKGKNSPDDINDLNDNDTAVQKKKGGGLLWLIVLVLVILVAYWAKKHFSTPPPATPTPAIVQQPESQPQPKVQQKVQQKPLVTHKHSNTVSMSEHDELSRQVKQINQARINTQRQMNQQYIKLQNQIQQNDNLLVTKQQGINSNKNLIGKLTDESQALQMSLNAIDNKMSNHYNLIENKIDDLNKKINEMPEMVNELDLVKKNLNSSITQLVMLQQQVVNLDKNMNQLVALNERMKQVIDRQGMIVQANNKIKNRSIQKPSYVVQAVIQGRAWLTNQDGVLITVREGQEIPGYGRVTKIDLARGYVIMSNSTVFKEKP